MSIRQLYPRAEHLTGLRQKMADDLVEIQTRIDRAVEAETPRAAAAELAFAVRRLEAVRNRSVECKRAMKDLMNLVDVGEITVAHSGPRLAVDNAPSERPFKGRAMLFSPPDGDGPQAA